MSGHGGSGIARNRGGSGCQRPPGGGGTPWTAHLEKSTGQGRRAGGSKERRTEVGMDSTGGGHGHGFELFIMVARANSDDASL